MQYIKPEDNIKFPNHLTGVWIGTIGVDLIKITLDISNQTHKIIGWFKKI